MISRDGLTNEIHSIINKYMYVKHQEEAIEIVAEEIIQLFESKFTAVCENIVG